MNHHRLFPTSVNLYRISKKTNVQTLGASALTPRYSSLPQEYSTTFCLTYFELQIPSVSFPSLSPSLPP
ncbi:hypothetical protein YC2023_094474 [Brassica napus]